MIKLDSISFGNKNPNIYNALLQNNIQNLPVTRFAINGSSLAPLKSDTISFGGNTKRTSTDIFDQNTTAIPVKKRSEKRLDKSDMGTRKVADDILSEIDYSYGKFKDDIGRIFGMQVLDIDSHANFDFAYRDSVKKGLKDDKPVLAITARKKKTASLMEKMGSKHIRTKKAAKETITDLMGIRIIVSGNGTDSGDYVADKLTEAVRKNWIKIVEIKNYRLKAKNQYISTKKLNALEDAARKAGVRNFKNDTKRTESGYTAVHMLVELPEGIKGELQIMGLDVLELKKIEDLCFKALTNKKLPPEYSEIEQMFFEIYDDNAKYQQFMEYTRRAYIYERERQPYIKNASGSYLPIPDDLQLLDKKFDFNNIAKIAYRASRAEKKDS